jgi:SAM-dependent methyltransferase
MRNTAELRGLRFPDDYVVKMFFKEGLHRLPGRVLELGCGSGNNLTLFSAFRWDVVGVDNDAGSLADAKYNLEGVGVLIECDLSSQFPSFEPNAFDAVLLPSVNYYIPRVSFVRVLASCRRAIRPGGMFYIRSRLPEDWRWGRGEPEGSGAFRLTCRETGEYGLLNVFYSPDDLWSAISQHLGRLNQAQTLRVTCDNPQAGVVVRNADVVIWGRVNGQ